jgi:Raf kinase inhibitor-like YbhB/YbcL family protein
MSSTISKSMTISSESFEPGHDIPMKYTCDGEDMSPQLSWDGAPEGTETFTLIMDDPDAPGRTFTHWVLYNISASRSELPEGVTAEKLVKKGCSQALNDFRMAGYGGPCPPPGKPHHYHFKLYALNTELDVPSGMPRSAIEAAMRGHVLAETEIVGLYKRKK